MKYSETTAPLTNEDIEILKSQSKNTFILAPVISCIIILFGYFIGGRPGLVVCSVIGVLIILIYLILRKRFRRELVEGVKLVLSGTISNKFTKEATSRGLSSGRGMSGDMTISYVYYIVLGEKELRVESWYYDRFKAGDDIEIHMTPRTKVILRIEKKH